MNQLLEDVLLVGKSEAGKIQFNSTHLDLISFCLQLAEETQRAQVAIILLIVLFEVMIAMLI